MDARKIAFIVCTNNPIYFSECEYYIRSLACPEDFVVDVIGIEDAQSMCEAYNAGMHSSDAKYKVYLHQDVFIREHNFILYLLERFRKDESIGMIGMVGGCGMPKTGVTYLAWNAGTVDCREPDMAYQLICAPEQKEDRIVDAVDGLLMATQYDVEWREDLFRDFDFYDVSQSFEMRKQGYQILVPYQQNPWVIHDSSFAKLDRYDKNRLICLKEYPEFFTEEDGFLFTYQEEWQKLSDILAGEIRDRIDGGDWENAAQMILSYRRNERKNSTLEMYGIMCDIHKKEAECGVETVFFPAGIGYKTVYEKYVTVKFLLRRLECDMPSEDYQSLKDAVENETVSCEALVILILHGTLNREKVLRKLMDWYQQAGRTQEYEYIRRVHEQVKGKVLPFAYSKRAAKKK